MFVIMGGAGHIGSQCEENLLRAGIGLTVLARKAKSAEKLAKLGAFIAKINVLDLERTPRFVKTRKQCLYPQSTGQFRFQLR